MAYYYLLACKRKIREVFFFFLLVERLEKSNFVFLVQRLREVQLCIHILCNKGLPNTNQIIGLRRIEARNKEHGQSHTGPAQAHKSSSQKCPSPLHYMKSAMQAVTFHDQKKKAVTFE